MQMSVVCTMKDVTWGVEECASQSSFGFSIIIETRDLSGSKYQATSSDALGRMSFWR